jgi:hypothetical protein
MGRTKARRISAIIAVSALVHIVFLAALILGVPWSGRMREAEQPPVEVTLERLPLPTPPEQPAKPKPLTKEPKPTPTKAQPQAAPAPPLALHAPPVQLPQNVPGVDLGANGDMDNAVRALRGSVGCSDPDAVGLTPQERAKCRERMRQGLENAKPILGLTAEKRQRFDRAVKCHDDYNPGDPIPPGHTPSNGAGGMPGLGYIPRARDCPPWAK